jgi:hypothetical protein
MHEGPRTSRCGHRFWICRACVPPKYTFQPCASSQTISNPVLSQQKFPGQELPRQGVPMQVTGRTTRALEHQVGSAEQDFGNTVTTLSTLREAQGSQDMYGRGAFSLLSKEVQIGGVGGQDMYGRRACSHREGQYPRYVTVRSHPYAAWNQRITARSRIHTLLSRHELPLSRRGLLLPRRRLLLSTHDPLILRASAICCFHARQQARLTPATKFDSRS